MEDDEWSLVQKIQRGICEQQSHGENVEAELEAERQARAEAKVNKPHKGLEEANIAHEGTLAALCQKNNNILAEMGKQRRTRPTRRGILVRPVLDLTMP